MGELGDGGGSRAGRRTMGVQVSGNVGLAVIPLLRITRRTVPTYLEKVHTVSTLEVHTIPTL
jgi:hypothetical protein